MLKLLQTTLASGATATSDVVILPIGKWHTDKYGDLDLSRKVADELIANFSGQVLGRDIRVDIDHEFGEAAGWITGLGIGTFADPVTGDETPAVVMRVNWTPGGAKSLAEGEYRYVSAAYGRYTQPATGRVFANVLRAVSLTNDPVMVVPPVDSEPLSVEFSDMVTLADGIKFGEVVDAVEERIAEQDAEPAPADLWAAQWGSWPAFAAMDELLRQAIADGLAGDALRARIAELSADLPEAIAAAIEAAVTRANDGEDGPEVAPAPAEVTPQTDPLAPAELADSTADSGVSDPVAEILDAFDALMGKADDIVRGAPGVRAMRTLAAETRSKLSKLLKGGTKMSDDKPTTPTPEAVELAELKATIRNEKVTAALDALSAKGMTEPARHALAAILTTETPDAIVLSEGAEPVEMPDAILAFASVVEFVPIATEDPGTALANTAGTITLTDAEIAFAKQQGVSEDFMLAAKVAKAEADNSKED
jgi:hypothetical protein